MTDELYTFLTGNKDKDLAKEIYAKKIEAMVNDEIYRGIKNGEVTFEKEQLDADAWKRLSEDERENHPFKWKYNSSFIIEAMMKTLSEKDQLFTDITAKDDGTIEFHLTNSGQELWVVGEMLKIDMQDFLWSRVKKGLGKEMSQYNIIKTGEKVEGYKRYRVNTNE